ncbi:glycoside hydrolase family 13 protein [Halobacillus sp. Marseille-Q1614]|uniref:glycoside hydrolase family 13 protein n=1 Tax=Halobacillus sp. Marseille-Q1614 TaxID=2709134 RepID=UPI0020C59B92|nr:glycoside hydrolase family 13 protein [Halobacillus sp. Marseille-Q1614]
MKKLLLVIVVVLFLMTFVQPIAQIESNADEQTYDTVVLRGSADSLDWGSNNNPLTYDEENKYWASAPITLEGGKTVEFKYVYDGNWMPGANLTFTPPQDGDYIFTFYPDEERRVDVQLADTSSGSLTLNLTVPKNTPGWVVPTLASNLNSFDYKVSPLTKVAEGIYEIEVRGEAGDRLEYVYSLGGESYKEVIDAPREATFTEDNQVYNDKVSEWENIPVAHQVTHNFNHTPYTPDKHDEPKVTVTVEHYGPIDEGAVYFTTDGSSPEGKRGDAENGKVTGLKVVETTSNKEGLYTSTLEGTIPKQKNNTRVKYKIDVWNSGSEGSQFADNNSLSSDEATEFAYYVEDYQSPEWAKESIIYQVFVDRFRDGEESNNTSTDPSLPEDERLKGWMGGDLQGVIEKLDYIESLGVNTLWVSPIYEGPYSHGYHATDFMNVDPRFGSNELMKELVDRAHERNMKVVYDLVPNHVSNKHDFFQDAVEKGESSQYYDWFTFLKWPDQYETFYDVKELPELNNDNPETREYMLETVVPFWMDEIGVDGFRLDYAKGPSYSFWVDFRHAVKQNDPDAFIFGEVWDSLEKITSYTGKLDGAIDFETQTAIYEAMINGGSMNDFGASLDRIFSTYHDEFIPATFLDSHDVPRFIYEAEGNTNTLKNAASLQFTLPGAPIIYYGDEVGLSQSGDHNLVDEWKDRYYREMMPWDQDEQDLDVKAHYQKLIEVRKENKALTEGELKIVHSTEDLLIYERAAGQQKVVVIVNQGDEKQSVELLDIYNQRTPNTVMFEPLLEDKPVIKGKKGNLAIESPAQSVEVYKVKGKLYN